MVAWPGLGAAGCLYEWLWRAKPWVRVAMRQGPSGLASSGVLPAGGVVAMWAGTIQARSSMACRQGSWAVSVVRTTALDPNRGMSVAAGGRVRPVGDHGQAFERR